MAIESVSRRQFLIAGGVTGLSGCVGRSTSGTSTFDWPQFGRTEAKTSAYPNAELDVSDGSASWSSPVGGGIVTSLVTADGSVLFGTSGGISAYDGQVGDRQWHAPLSETPTGTPAVSRGTVVATATENPGDQTVSGAIISAFDVSSADLLWQLELEDSEYIFSPTVTANWVLVRTIGRLLAVTPDSGIIEWELTGLPKFEDPANTNLTDLSPAVSESVVYVPNPGGISAYDVEREEIAWNRELPKIRSSPAVAGAQVFASSVSSGIYVLDASTGDVEWHWSGTGCWTTPVITQDTVYATANGMLIALDRSDGTKRWEFDIHGDVYGTPLVVGDTVVAGSIGWTAVAVDTRSGILQSPGKREWVFTGYGTRTTPAAADGRLYVPDGNQSLVAIAD